MDQASDIRDIAVRCLVAAERCDWTGLSAWLRDDSTVFFATKKRCLYEIKKWFQVRPILEDTPELHERELAQLIVRNAITVELLPAFATVSVSSTTHSFIEAIKMRRIREQWQVEEIRLNLHPGH